MDVDALDAAAALAGVVHRRVHQRLDRGVEVGVGADVARVLAAELEPGGHEGAGGGALDLAAAAHAAGEVDEVEGPGGDQLGGGGVVEEEVAEEALGQVREGLRQPLAGQRGLAGMLQHHGVAGDQRRHDGVDRGQERVVPGGDDEDQAERLARQGAAEAVAVLDHHRGQRGFGDPGHVGGALAHAAHLAAVADRPAHLPGELGDEIGVDPVEPRHALADQLDPLGERPRRPALLRGARGGEPGADAVGRLQRAGGVDAAVHRRDARDALPSSSALRISGRAIRTQRPA